MFLIKNICASRNVVCLFVKLFLHETMYKCLSQVARLGVVWHMVYGSSKDSDLPAKLSVFASHEKLIFGMCKNSRFRSVCAYKQFHQNLSLMQIQSESTGNLQILTARTV